MMNRKPTLAGRRVMGCSLIGLAAITCLTGAVAAPDTVGVQGFGSYRGSREEHSGFIQRLGTTSATWLHLERFPDHSKNGGTRYALIFGNSPKPPASKLALLTVFITPPLDHPGHTTRMVAQTLFHRLANPQLRHRLLDHLTLVLFLSEDTVAPRTSGRHSVRIPGLLSPWDHPDVDLLKAHSQGVRNWLRLFHQWNPDVVMELAGAETANWRAQCLFGSAPAALLPAPLSALAHRLTSEARSAWQQHNVQVRTWFRLLNPASPSLGVTTEPSRLSDPIPYSALNHALAFRWIWNSKPKGQHLSTKIWRMLDPWFNLLIQNRSKILRARTQSRTNAHGDPVVVDLPLSGKTVRKATPFLLHTYAYDETLSPISGTVWVRYNKHQPQNYIVPRFARPFITLKQSGISGYLIPSVFIRAIQALKRNGIKMKIFRRARTLRVIVDQLERIRWSIPPQTRTPTIHSYRTLQKIRLLTYPAGSAFVPLNQTQSALVVALLDPDSPYNLLYLGFFHNLFDHLPHMHQARLETIARQLLRTHPKLARGFLRRILNPRFAGNPRRRLDFFYRHLFRDPVSRHLYPVAEWPTTSQGESPLPAS